jgi:ribonuclease HI
VLDAGHVIPDARRRAVGKALLSSIENEKTGKNHLETERKMPTTTDNAGTHWVRMRFKRNKVWVASDPQGRPLLTGERARIKYQLEQDQDYRVRAEHLQGLEAPAPETVPPKPPGRPRSPAADLLDGRTVHIYTDGASSGNPGPSGIGVVLRYGDQRKEISAYIGEATNNIAELMAIEKGLTAVKNRSLPVRVYTDSSYAFGVLCLSWKPKKNLELIAGIRHAMTSFTDLRLVKVPGHSGVEENERADRLAVAAIRTRAGA